VSAELKASDPMTVTWMRFRKNLAAMAGVIVITGAFLISVFCYLIMPDSSPNANQMNLSLSTMRPGFSVKQLLIPRPFIRSTNFISEVFNGKSSPYSVIPIDTIWFKKDSLFFNRYTDEFIDEEVTEVMHLTDVFPGNISSRKIDHANRTVQWVSDNGLQRSLSFTDIRNEIEHEQIVHRKYFLGTDKFGRDMLSRLLAGTRVSLSVGFIAVAISLIIGILLGSLAGFFRGWVDQIIMWMINVIWSIPTLLLVIAITMALGKGFSQVFIAVGLTMWVEVARVVRGQIFSIREMEYIEAGRALGYKNFRVIVKHILPNIMGPVFVIAASNFASAILLEAGLSFLGMGAQPPTPSWGMMIKENYGYIVVDAAYLAILPGVAIMLLVLAFTFIGNGLRDAFDTKESDGAFS